MLLAQKLTNPVINAQIGNLQNSAQGGTVLQLFLRNGINLAFGVGGLIFFIVLLRGSLAYITAGGDKDAVDKARKQLTTGFIGVAILFSVYAIIFIVEALFGISIRRFNIPTI